MPKVPTITRQISPNALPGARLTASETQLSTGVGVSHAKARAALQEGQGRAQVFGALVGVGEQLGRLGNVATQIVVAERQRADEVAVMEGENRLALAMNKISTEAMSFHGKNALGVPESHMGQFNEAADAIEVSLTTEKQKNAFRRSRANRGAQLDLQLRRHTLGEMEAYDGAQVKASVENSVAFAIANATDPKRVSYELGNAVNIIETTGKRLGKSSEQVEHEVLSVQTATHVGVVESLIVQDKLKAAKVYFEEARSAEQISGDAQARVIKALEEGAVRKEAQDTFDNIIATADEKDWVKAARGIEDPKVRDDVENRVLHQQNINDRLRREEIEAIGVNSKNIIDKTGDWRRIPQKDWARLGPGEAAQLKSYAERKVTQIAVKTDPGTYSKMVTLATSADPEEHEKFVKMNMMGLVNKLSSSDWQQFVDAQAKTRKGDIESVQKLLVNETIQKKMVEEALLGMGMDPTPKQPGTEGFKQVEVNRVNLFRRTVREEVAAIEARTGKPATDMEVQAVVDLLRTPTGTKLKSKGFGSSVGISFFDKQQAAFAFDELTIDDVPAATRSQIMDSLRRAGKPFDDMSVIRVYRSRAQ